jgi:hypothetical protein
MKNNIEYIKNKIQQAFGKYTFIEDGHYYLCNGKRVGISTTGLISQYEQKFDSDTISQQVADKKGISQQEVLEEWRIENLHSTIKGSMVHEFAQSLWEGKEYKFDYSNVPKEIDLDRLKSDIQKLIPQAINFYNDYKDIYELIGCEIYLGDEEFDECGAADQIMLNKLTGGIAIIDYKTNKKIEYESYKNKKMLIPLHKFDDCNYVHYSFQLGDYKYKFEKNTNLKIDETFIVCFNINADNYEIIEPLNMKNEVEEILENRRITNMNGMGVLLMGASGSGKSTSLRNLPAEETAIINITNKPMPFRNKDGKTIVTLKDFEKEGEKDLSYEELYKRIIATIKSTKKKIIVIDDSSYMMAFENFEKATNKGYDKFTNMAKNYYDLIKSAISCGDEKIVYIITHEEIDDVNQLYRPKTIGKMLSNQLVIEGLFSIVLRSMYKNGEYIFQTQNDGTSVCKSPMYMFEQKEIPNDLYEVDKIIREYYGFKPLKEEKKEGEK